MTQIQICNMALRLLGVARITSLSDSNEQARVLTDVYTPLLEEILSAHPWNFAIKRDTLVEVDTEPEFGYDHAFQLPTDCLRVIRMEDSDVEFVRESDQLLTDEGEAKVKYIARITDTTKYTPAFVSALAARLASEIAYPLTNSTSLSETMYKLYLEKLNLAKGIDAQEGTGEKLEDLSWEESRE